jgi:glutamine amidotransferase-like uncharacterized protein
MYLLRYISCALIFLISSAPLLAEHASGTGSTKAIMIPASPNILKHKSKISTRVPRVGSRDGAYIGQCGGSYVCSNGAAIVCGNTSKPFEDSQSNCYCWTDSCR